MPLIVSHWTVLKHSSENIVCSSHKDLPKGHLLHSVVKLLNKLLSYSRRKRGSVVFLRCYLSCLKLRLFPNQKPGPYGIILFIHTRGYLEVSGNFCLPLARFTYAWQPSALLYTICTWLMYCISTFRIFECRSEQHYKAKQHGKKAH